MPQFDDTKLTEAVIQSFASAPDPRVRAVLGKLVSHLHAFVRDAGVTLDEWHHAIDFLTRTGHACDGFRQEFILLSDVLGVSMLVDAINHGHAEGATDTTVLGPFYSGEHRLAAHGSDVAKDAPGDRVFVDAHVSDASGRPIAGATIDVWHADGTGLYDSQRPGYTADQPSMRARFVSDASGRFYFRTIVPHSYPIPIDGPVGELMAAGRRSVIRPAHIHFLLRAGGYETLVTHVFVAGDAHLATDAVFGVKPSLIAPLISHEEPTYPDGTPAPARWYQLSYRFALKAASMTANKPEQARKEIAR
jgi:protocatechuate 3,4-dioxygenase beta subunit